jgi:hypothetical protein
MAIGRNRGGVRLSGYSGTPLATKLGIKPGSKVFVSNAPKEYRLLVAPLPEGAKIVSLLDETVDLIHAFRTKKRELARFLQATLNDMRNDAAIWLSWPKQASGMPTDVTEDTIRAVALPLGLVDIKVCAIDDVWSGLKLVIRKEKRGGRPG